MRKKISETLTFRKKQTILEQPSNHSDSYLPLLIMYKPDRTDWQIISLLNEDGRISNTDIARKVGNISARTASNRINTLTEQGIINIRAIINPEEVGYGILADVFIQADPGSVLEVAELVAAIPQVSYVACAIGEADVSISLRARTIEELFNFVNEKLGKLPGVRRTQTRILPLKLKDITTWLPPNMLDANDSNES